MTVDIGKLEKDHSLNVEFEEKIPLPEYLGGTAPIVSFEGTLSRSENKYMLKGKASTVLELVCDRCLAKFDKVLSIDIDEVFVRRKDLDNDEILFEGSEISLDEALRSSVILAIPTKTVCKEDCKGLCQKCGCNLNVSECGCDRTYVNPYFEDISFFVNDKEV